MPKYRLPRLHRLMACTKARFAKPRPPLSPETLRALSAYDTETQPNDPYSYLVMLDPEPVGVQKGPDAEAPLLFWHISDPDPRTDEELGFTKEGEFDPRQFLATHNPNPYLSDMLAREIGQAERIIHTALGHTSTVPSSLDEFLRSVVGDGEPGLFGITAKEPNGPPASDTGPNTSPARPEQKES